MNTTTKSKQKTKAKLNHLCVSSGFRKMSFTRFLQSAQVESEDEHYLLTNQEEYIQVQINPVFKILEVEGLNPLTELQEERVAVIINNYIEENKESAIELYDVREHGIYGYGY